jgi:hypothetical protein
MLASRPKLTWLRLSTSSSLLLWALELWNHGITAAVYHIRVCEYTRRLCLRVQPETVSSAASAGARPCSYLNEELWRPV